MINEIITDFNSTLLSLANNIATVCPTSIIGTNIRDIEREIKKKENFRKFIDLFCIKVLVYKDKIDSGDEDFFMSKDYGSDLRGHGDALDHVLTLKSVWSELTQENKEIVKMNMQILCELCLQYYISIRKK